MLAADLYAVWQVVMQLANELAETAVVVGDVEVGSRVGSVVEDGSQEDGSHICSHRHGIGTHTPNTHSYTHSVPANTWHGVHVCQLVHWVPAHGFVGSRA